MQGGASEAGLDSLAYRRLADSDRVVRCSDHAAAAAAEAEAAAQAA